MSTLLSYQEALSFPPPIASPQYVVLNTAARIQQLATVMARLPVLVWEKDEVLQFILSFLQDEASALTALEYGCLEMVHDAAAAWCGYFTYDHRQSLLDDISLASNVVVTLGKSIFAQLQEYHAYQWGRLDYEFHGWCARYDAVLTKC